MVPGVTALRCLVAGHPDRLVLRCVAFRCVDAALLRGWCLLCGWCSAAWLAGALLCGWCCVVWLLLRRLFRDELPFVSLIVLGFAILAFDTSWVFLGFPIFDAR